ncbi:early transcribed membrane protein 13 [Plasmodium gaboni]|uniref:Early transcribed membrane protein 13 n=1 Tax=Plasmodium gaboni TaxID=647221 RepID=A0A151LCW7_9APIC|nr:early transcribed membrane protein 13 [Plasmodium gaboni]KYN96824.1 early transcribed membrane protein 13 [Plasmodium gaboni]
MKVSKLVLFTHIFFIINILCQYISLNASKINIKGIKTQENKKKNIKKIDKSIEEQNKRKKIIYYSLIASGAIASVAAILGLGYYAYKNSQEDDFYYNKYLKYRNGKYNIKYQDGAIASTSEFYIEPEGINKVNLNKPIIENNNNVDVSIKKYNNFVDIARVSIQKHFESLSNDQKDSHVNNIEYMQKFVQGLQENRNISLSKYQENKAVMDLQYHLQKVYANYLSQEGN